MDEKKDIIFTYDVEFQFYYMFGFLFLVFLVLVVTCAEIPVVLCYFQLCGEDYLWWWRSYLTSGSSTLYFFLYTAFYMLVDSYSFFVLAGTIGFYACVWFTRLIYSHVKID